MSQAHYSPGTDQVRIRIDPESAGWRYLAFEVVAPGSGFSVHEPDREGAIVPLGGAGQAIVDAETFDRVVQPKDMLGPK